MVRTLNLYVRILYLVTLSMSGVSSGKVNYECGQLKQAAQKLYSALNLNPYDAAIWRLSVSALSASILFGNHSPNYPLISV